MPAATPIAQRRRIIKKFLAGQSMSEISREEDLNYGTVWTLCKRYQESGLEGLKPKYGNCGPSAHQSDELVYRAVICLKAWHPTWGAGRIKALILQKYPQAEVPSERTLQRWFRQNGQNQPKSKLPKEPKQWAEQVHEIWQIDAKEEIRLKSGQKVCWLNIEDEKSSAIIDPPVFPPQEDL